MRRSLGVPGGNAKRKLAIMWLFGSMWAVLQLNGLVPNVTKIESMWAIMEPFGLIWAFA